MSGLTVTDPNYELWVLLQQTGYAMKMLRNKNSARDEIYTLLSRAEKEELSASLQKLLQASVDQLNI